MTKPILSKTQYMAALDSLSDNFQKAANDNGKTSKESEASKQARREMGDRIGALAKDCFPGGVEVPAHHSDVAGGAQQTKDLIAAGETIIFEATAINPGNGSYCRADVLRKVHGTDEWDLIEVKSGTKVKPEYVQDVAFQRYVFEGAGYKIRDCYLMHVNTGYVSGSAIDPRQLFTLENITKAVAQKSKYVAPKVAELIAHKTGKAHIDREAVGDFVADVEYPVYYLDYETVSAAIPLYEGTSPYQQVPFQFSLHVQQVKGGPLTHISFLHKETTDPRRAFAEALIDNCGTQGSVVVYYKEFEGGRNGELAKAFPDLAQKLKDINARMVDIFEPFRQRWMYDPAQNGSASLKAVLPAYTNISYKDMAIGNGEQALQEYMAFATGFKTDPAEIAALWDRLEEYCGQDTYAMVALLDKLYEVAEPPGPQAGTAPSPGPQ